MISIGGLGGGGDSGGSLSIALALKRMNLNVLILAMLNASKRDILGARSLAGSLIEVYSNSWSSGRFFEPHIASIGWKVYALCLKDGLEETLNGLKYLKEKLGVKTIIGVDFGADVLVKGDEPDVGTTSNDSLGLAVLVEAREKLKLKTFLGVGVLGGEFGGCIPMELLVENILEIVKNKGYLGAYMPRDDIKKEFLGIAGYLLSRVPSLMLSIYTDALKNKLGKNFYSIAYFRGYFKVEEYHKYIFFFDPIKACQINTFCQVALKRKRLEYVKKAVKSRQKSKRKGLKEWEKILHKLIRKQLDLKTLK
ncbi:MAG TPA: DUF1152 domain-containing protein [Thermoprotei archaeon]|nr:DUF1152 domain-containing protein [Thermoprotei archaeon]